MQISLWFPGKLFFPRNSVIKCENLDPDMTMIFSYILWDCQSKTKDRAKSWKKISVLLISSTKDQNRAQRSIWALANSQNIRATTFEFIIGEMADRRLMSWSANWFSWIRSCTFCLCKKNWWWSTSDFLVLLYFLSVLTPCFCYSQSYAGISQVELTGASQVMLCDGSHSE